MRHVIKTLFHKHTHTHTPFLFTGGVASKELEPGIE